MPHFSFRQMFHVKHSSPRTSVPPRMFHVKHRGFVAVLLGLVALIGTGCAAVQNPEGWAPPVSVGDQLLVQSNKGQMSLVDATSGRVVWTYPDRDSRDRTFYATPIVDGLTVYLADYSGRITRLNVGGGTPAPAWTTDVSAQVVATPAYANGHHVPTRCTCCPIAYDRPKKATTLFSRKPPGSILGSRHRCFRLCC